MATSDKDGCLVVYAKDLVADAIFKKMQTGVYHRTHCTNSSVDAFSRKYNDICEWLVEDVLDSVKPGLFYSLTKCLRFYGAWGMAFRLDFNVKTHKCAGEVAVRLLHTAVKHLFRPAMSFIGKLLRIKLSAIPHLLSGTVDAIRILRGFRLRNDQSFVLIDIKEYFLSGSHDVLVTACKPYLPDHLRQSGSKMLAFLLESQIVYDRWNDLHYHVVKGSGMGMPMAGEVSDASFHGICEIPMLALGDRFGISLYMRFKDDILLACDTNKVDRLVTAFRRYAVPFVLKLEGVHRESFQYLDLEIKIVEGHVSLSSATKNSNLSQPLSSTSAHKLSIHNAWPLAQLDRIARNSSTKQIMIDSISKYIVWFSSHDPSHMAIPVMRARLLCLVPGVPCPSVPHVAPIFTHSSTLVMPYTSGVYGCGIRKLCNKHNIRIAWTLGGAHLFSKVKAASKHAEAEIVSTATDVFYSRSGEQRRTED